MTYLVIFLFIYALFLGIICWFWLRIHTHEKARNPVFVSVIVPVRNEEPTIQATIQCILACDYPDDQMEVLVVNDHSTDQTAQVVSAFNTDKVQLVELDEGSFGKKAAIAKGVKVSHGQLIVCTDGDSVVEKGWLWQHVNSFDKGKMLSFGPVQYKGNTFWSKILDIELSALVGIGAATSQMGFPTMLNGCNYSFSKDVFSQVMGFKGNENIATGDDEFLVRKIGKLGSDKIGFLKSKAALVVTDPPKGLSNFFLQRKRWASKWKYHKDAISKILPVTVSIMYALFIGLIMLNRNNLGLNLAFIGAKLIVDYIFLLIVRSAMAKTTNLIAVIFLEIIYPFYVLFFSVASNFGHYRWKGRNHQV